MAPGIPGMAMAGGIYLFLTMAAEGSQLCRRFVVAGEEAAAGDITAHVQVPAGRVRDSGVHPD